MSTLEKKVRVAASVEEVWSVLADFGAVASWAPTITDSGTIGDANAGVGARRTCTHVKMGALEETIVPWTEGEAYSYDVTAGLPFPMKALRNHWSGGEREGSTEVTLLQEFSTKLGPLGSLVELMIMKRMMRREMRLALAGLKQYVETGEPVRSVGEISPPVIAAVA